MRKSFAIILISLHLLGNTEANQLLRLPQLLSHFFQHHRQDPSISFFDFVAMHYAGDDGTTADDDFDSQLPCHNLNHNTIGITYSPMVNEMQFCELLLQEAGEYSSRLQTGVTSKHVLLVLQPPRLV